MTARPLLASLTRFPGNCTFPRFPGPVDAASIDAAGTSEGAMTCRVRSAAIVPSVVAFTASGPAATEREIDT
jgi:hypothetical protein